MLSFDFLRTFLPSHPAFLRASICCWNPAYLRNHSPKTTISSVFHPFSSSRLGSCAGFASVPRMLWVMSTTAAFCLLLSRCPAYYIHTDENNRHNDTGDRQVDRRIGKSSSPNRYADFHPEGIRPYLYVSCVSFPVLGSRGSSSPLLFFFVLSWFPSRSSFSFTFLYHP